jgi:hypothetical protein
MHRAATNVLRGTSPAPSRTPFGLRILRDNLADVKHWVDARGLTCTQVVRGLQFLTCTNVAAAVLGDGPGSGAVQDLTFTFDPTGALLGVDVLHGGLAREDAAALALAIEARLMSALGTPTIRTRTFGPADVGASPYRTSSMAYRFSDYLVTLTTVQMPGRGVTVRQAYVGLPSSSS